MEGVDDTPIIIAPVDPPPIAVAATPNAANDTAHPIANEDIVVDLPKTTRDDDEVDGASKDSRTNPRLSSTSSGSGIASYCFANIATRPMRRLFVIKSKRKLSRRVFKKEGQSARVYFRACLLVGRVFSDEFQKKEGEKIKNEKKESRRKARERRRK